MPKTRQQKEGTIERLGADIKSAKGVVFANFQGLTIKDTDELRNACKVAGVRYTITKKTLLKKAIETAGFSIDTKPFQGGVSVLSSLTDEVAPAAILSRFAKTHEIAKAFSGILDGQLIDGGMIAALAKFPSKQQLLGQLVGTLNAPVSGFVNVLAGNIRGLVTALSAIKDKKPASIT